MTHTLERQSVAPQPMTLWVLKGMLLILGMAAIFPGINMILDPTGTGVGFPEGALAGSPFSSYFIPGVLLTVFIGLLPLATVVALWKKPSFSQFQRINPFPWRHWAWTSALICGIGLMTWIIVQMFMVPYFFLQPLLLSWGAVIVFLCFTPGVRAFYDISKPPQSADK